MPIRIPDTLPARAILEAEGVALLGETDAVRQDIRPLEIGLLNLMPNKARTETQLARLIGAGPLQVNLTLVRIAGHTPKNTPEDHLISYYQTWDEIRDRRFDGFLVTGAPVETLGFDEVTYWDELAAILDWTRTHVHSSFFICWGAMAAIWRFHGIEKHLLNEKAFGVYRHKNLVPTSPYLAGFSDDFQIPVSRWTEMRREDIAAADGLELLMDSDFTGPCLIAEPAARSLYVFNHIEYDTTSLKEEFERDLAAGRPVRPPHNYFPGDDITASPLNRWRSHAQLLFRNWVNQVYQTTPFDLSRIGR